MGNETSVDSSDEGIIVVTGDTFAKEFSTGECRETKISSSEHSGPTRPSSYGDTTQVRRRHPRERLKISVDIGEAERIEAEWKEVSFSDARMSALEEGIPFSVNKEASSTRPMFVPLCRPDVTKVDPEIVQTPSLVGKSFPTPSLDETLVSSPSLDETKVSSPSLVDISILVKRNSFGVANEKEVESLVLEGECLDHVGDFPYLCDTSDVPAFESLFLFVAEHNFQLVSVDFFSIAVISIFVIRPIPGITVGNSTERLKNRKGP